MPADESPTILRPLPRRSFQLTPTSTEPGTPPSPAVDSFDGGNEKSIPPSRTRSILNLTSSTLFGIYSAPDDGSGISQSATPFGTGAMTPSIPNAPFSPLGMTESGKHRLPDPHAFEKGGVRISHNVRARKATFLQRTARAVVLFVLGIAYGEVATRLHEETELVPVKMEGIDRHTWYYLLFWGAAGVVLGHLLPWVDGMWEYEEESGGVQVKDDSERQMVDWSLVVRGVGAFIGLAFAIRKLPWESSMQASLTLALANPATWYLIDRSLTGFLLSTSVGIVGAAVILGVNPDWVPSTTPAGNVTETWAASKDLSSFLSYEHIAVSTWVASVLFCSCVCFGNIGRVLHGRGTRA